MSAPSTLSPAASIASSTDTLESIIDTASFLSDLLGTPSPRQLSPASPPPALQNDPPPLGPLPCKTLRLPTKRIKIPRAVAKNYRSIYNTSVNELRRVAQQEYDNLAESLDTEALAKVAALLRTSFYTFVQQFAQLAVEACLDAHELSLTMQKSAEEPASSKASSSTVKRPFDRTWVAIFEYIFDQPTGKYPSIIDKRRLADLSGMAYRQIAVWFQNRRARTKKKIKAGKQIEPMTLDKAVVKLRADREKARRTQKGSAEPPFQWVTIKRKNKIVIEEEPDPDDDGWCYRDLLEDEEYYQHAIGNIPNIDDWEEPDYCYPTPFEGMLYEPPRFDAPVWVRTPEPPSEHSFIPVLQGEVAMLAQRFERVVALEKTEEIITKERVKFTLPLPRTVQAALDRRKLKGSRRRQKQPQAVEPHRLDEENGAGVQAITSDTEDLNLQVQEQIVGPQIISDQTISNLSSQVSSMKLRRKRRGSPSLPIVVEDLVEQVDFVVDMRKYKSSSGSSDDSHSGDEESRTSAQPSRNVSDQSDDSSDESSYRLDAALNPSDSLMEEDGERNPLNHGFSFAQIVDLRDTHHSSVPSSPPHVSEQDMEDACDTESGQHPAALYEPIINAELDPFSLEEQLPKDPQIINQIVKMTLDQLGMPYPENIDEPFIPTVHITLAPNPAEGHLTHLFETAKLYDDQFRLPEDINFTPHLQHYREYHDHSRELPADPIMDLIPDQELLEQEPEHTLLYDLQASFPSMIFEEVEAPPGWYPEPAATNPDDPSDIALEPLATPEVLPYIVARWREPEPKWTVDEYDMQRPPLTEQFGYGYADPNDPGWLGYICDQDWNALETASKIPPPQAPSQAEPRPRRRRRRQKPSVVKPAEPGPVPTPPTVEEPDVFYVSLPLPEPEPMPAPESTPNEPIITGWAGNVRDFLCAMINHAFDRTPEEISMLHYLNF